MRGLPPADHQRGPRLKRPSHAMNATVKALLNTALRNTLRPGKPCGDTMAHLLDSLLEMLTAKLCKNTTGRQAPGRRDHWRRRYTEPMARTAPEGMQMCHQEPSLLNDSPYSV